MARNSTKFAARTTTDSHERTRQQAFKNHPDAQIIIYGKKGHAEVNGLVGQTNGKAIVIEKIQDID
ncbi:MAG: hypothetical protein ACPHYG_07590, partial [Flavobacteriales bacterium]